MSEEPIAGGTKKLFLAFLLLAIGGGIVGFAFYGDKINSWRTWWSSIFEPGDHKQPPSKEPGDVEALGSLVPKSTVIKVGVTVPDAIEKIEVKKKDVVEKGHPLARLQSYSDRKTEVELAKSQLKEAEDLSAAIKKDADAKIAEVDAKRKQADDAAILENKIQQANLKALLANQEKAKKDLQRLKDLKDKTKDAIYEPQIEQQALQVIKAEADVNAAQLTVNKLNDILKNNEVSTDLQKQSLVATRNRGLQEIPLASLKNKLDIAVKRLDNAILKAPIAGTILDISAQDGDLTGNQPIFLMANTDQMMVIAEVYESDKSRIHEGQAVKVRSKALFPNDDSRTLDGTVEDVGNIISKNSVFDLDPLAAADRRVMEVTIRLASSKEAAKFIKSQVYVKFLSTPPGAK